MHQKPGTLKYAIPACNSVAVKPELNLSGMVINPFTDNLVLKIELIQKLHEADEKMAKQPKADQNDTTAVSGICEKSDRIFCDPKALVYGKSGICAKTLR